MKIVFTLKSGRTVTNEDDSLAATVQGWEHSLMEQFETGDTFISMYDSKSDSATIIATAEIVSVYIQ